MARACLSLFPAVGRWSGLVALLGAMIRLQAVIIEDFEYYAVYESNYLDLLWSFITFKPVEYGCEIALAMLVGLWQMLVHACRSDPSAVSS
ncbi:hypothetical protein XM38_022610 [Halomicronema hongdechloris C2206]|uniref:Uncharacterized protein n=1 Tax=Halomicronema hongdechloris C2206 TaxID=1641165 RepID=A0A1Z3HLW1_9CYAN|nr:hypothetical protein [Halomicronema hongdechloris]ASC71309.1 hypothetical protein XM38_022610 [Halomicronema hongdechloris C2206]